MRNKILPLVILVVIVVAGLTVFSLMKPKPDVDFVFSPSVSKAVVDGKKGVKQGKVYLAPGKHTVKVSFPGFADKSQTFSVTASSVQKVTVLLIPNSQAGYDWLNAHPSEGALRENIGSQNYLSEDQQRLKKYPIIKDLPHVDNFYRIDSGKSQMHPNDSTAVAIYITFYSEEGKQQALQWMSFKGYNPADYEIIYQDKTSQGFN